MMRFIRKAFLDPETLQSHTWSLYVYRKGDIWAFDYSSLGIKAEPFVAGIPAIINFHLEKHGMLEQAKREGFALKFTAEAELNHTDIILDLDLEKDDGGVYRDRESGLEGWLCPALKTFFTNAPPTLKVELGIPRRSK